MLENWLFMFDTKTIFQHMALGPHHWLGRDVRTFTHQSLRHQRHEPQPEQGWADSTN